MQPRLLDLFCGAGGAAMGYHRAGFEVVGVDIKPQPHYPFEFHQADALTYPLYGFDAYHASPPCQAYSLAGATHRSKGKIYPELITATRNNLISTGKPFVIENVPNSPLINPIKLNGAMFEMLICRDRLFETSFPMDLLLLPQNKVSVKMGRPVKDGEVICPVGHFPQRKYAERQMGIDWMSKQELTQAIPPAYTEYIGKYLMQAVLEYSGVMPKE